MSLQGGSHLGHYEILSLLGAGGMGEVYRARDTRLDRIVAIKSLSSAFSGDPERLARIQREARLLASLSHPNIGAIHGLEEADGVPYLILEFVDGETLSSRLARGALPVREAVDIGIQIAAAMEAAHERGVIHRDLKPANVMLTPSGGVKVLDFGLAKGGVDAAETVMTSNAPTSSGTGVISGTAAYMSPEQARGRPLDCRTDVWSFGCVLYECLAGCRAFSGETIADIMVRVLERDPDWRAISPSIPPALIEIIRGCLQKEASRRPGSLTEIRLRLAEIAREISVAAESTSRSGREPASAAPADSAPPSLAVLYFENLSSDPESDYFCAGITEDILTDLSKIRGIRVASRNAVARFRGAPADISKVASELGVGVVLEGSVRRAGERVRISAQLINATDGFHIWAERYDRTLQDVFAVQEEIASSIAASLRVALTSIESERLTRDRPHDARAYDLYLKGRVYYGRYTRDSIRYALELFQQATAVDPSYALAFAGIADCYGQMIQWGLTDDPEEAKRLGLEAARRAVALNPGLPEGHKAEALVLDQMGERKGSRAAILRAIEADPRFTPALLNLAVSSFAGGDLAEAERLIRRVIEIDPHDAFGIMWFAYLMFLTDRDEEALAARDRLRRLSSEVHYVTAAAAVRSMIHLRRGDLAAAQRDVREGYADGADPAQLRAIEATIAARSGRTEDARRLVTALASSTGIDAEALAVAAGAALRIGDTEQAESFMTRAMVESTGPILIRLDPELHPLLDREPFAPRCLDLVLVWPLEAPALDPARRALFSEVRVESGMPRGSEAGVRIAPVRPDPK